MEPQFGSRSRIVATTKPNTETPTPPQAPVQEVAPQVTPTQAPVGADMGGIERVVRGLLTEFFAGNQQSPLATSSVRSSDLDPAVSPDPDRQFSQSGVPMDQRIFEPEAVTTSDASINDAVAEAMATPEPEPEVVPTAEPVAEQTDDQETLARPSSRLDSKLRETNQYEQKLYSTNETERVEGVQGSLSRLGYVPRGIDGETGAGTRSALRHFQRANNLEVTGEADEATMSSLKAAEAPAPFSFSEATEGLYTNYVDDGIEGSGHHLGGADYRDVGITLEAGIVPDSGLKYKHNGTVITLPNNRAQRWSVLSAAGVTRRNFDTDNVITDDVVKSGIRRKDYSSDEAFTKAVLTGFQDKAEDTWVSLGYDRDDFNSDARKTLADMAWNAGTDAIGYNSMRPVLTELAKDVENRDTTAMRGLLNTAPTQSGRILGGVMKRRAIQYNWSVPEEDRIERVTSSSRTGQGVYYYENGDTYTISRTNGADTQDEMVPSL